MTDLEKVLEYFELDDDVYYIKKGYICLWEGFVDDLVIYISRRGETLFLTTPSSEFELNIKGNHDLTVYKIERVAYV